MLEETSSDFPGLVGLSPGITEPLKFHYFHQKQETACKTLNKGNSIYAAKKEKV